LLQSGDLQVWQPWDTPAAVGRFLAHFKPHVGLLMETEVWPNLVAQCARVRVPLCLVNARMSEKSLRKAQRLAWLARPAYRGLRAVWAQAPQDAARLASLGAPVKGVFGNFKFDATPDAGQIAQGRAWRMALGRPVIVFANSREGEEAIFLRILKQHVLTATVECAQGAINSEASQVQWMLVPRHPQRFDEVANLCRQEGFTVSRRSQWNAVGPGAADVWLGDSMGEMAQYYAMSDVALLGGSFAPLGGHNLIEATACECPIVMGPHTFNFALAAELALAAGAGFAADDLPHAVDKAMKLVCAEKALRHARAAARSFGALHRGAAQRTASAVRAVLLY
jgi:3-deoxy-D-manno-octulosonic-acid transferase